MAISVLDTPRKRSDSGHAAAFAKGTNRIPALAAAVACGCFGLIHILNIHPIGDGLWFWYARLFREGHRLYRDMHLNLPPFFVLVTAINQSLFGTSWLASKIPAAAQVVVFVTGLYLVSGYAPVRAWTRAFLISAAFFMAIAVSFARFDDYHVPTYIAIVYSAWLLLRYRGSAEPRGEWLLALSLAALGAVSLGNRLNDGASLVAAQAVLLPLFLRRRRLAGTALFLVATPVLLALLVLSTGDSLLSWANESIFRAAAIKGGTGNIMLAPFLYPFRQAAVFVKERYQAILFCLIVLVLAVMTYVVRSHDRARTWQTRQAALGTGALLLLFLAAGNWLRLNMLSLTSGSMIMLVMTMVMVVLAYQAVRQAVRGGLRSVNPLPLLLLLPFLQGMGAAMTAAKAIPETSPAAGLLLLMLPISVPAMAAGAGQALLLSLAFLLTAYGIPMKVANPYQWQDYFDQPMFAGREWYRHPLYGPMYIERDQAKLVSSICARVETSGKSATLLSVPNPYSNYFCGIEPWHGYVQTWYDTSSAATIERLISELESDPPEWIVYQRNLKILAGHEYVYGKPLMHRKLDALFADRLQSGAWSIAMQQCYNGSDWILIQTRPVTPGKEDDTLLPASGTMNLCQRTLHDLRLP